ncbi:MAG TPA: glycosyltransferase family 39 protein [Methyloceanibacter sp.]
MQRQNADAQRFQADYFVPLLLWLGALLAVRIAALVAARIDLVLDEAQYWTWSRELALGYFSKPPMIAWLVRGATEICGNGEACVRAASPVLYTVTAILIYAAARQLYSERIAFWSAIVFATLPGVSYSSMLITTDVPLVLFWSLALYAWIMLVKGGEMRFAVLLGMAVGLGLLSKQAMIYFVLCATCHAIFSRDAREALRGGRGIVAAAIALAFAAPMLIWNAQHDFVTFQHTATNIGWKFPYVHPLALLDYVVVQFGVFGPILMAVYLRAAFRAFREKQSDENILLLSFSLPVLALLFIQALLSRAHGNWTAVAYPAATILATAVLFELGRLLLFRISLALHLAVAALIAMAPVLAPQLPLFERLQFLSRVVGWRGVADAVHTKLAEDHYGSILVDSREMAAELLYYLRDNPTPLYVWLYQPKPMNQYELTRAMSKDAADPVLFVTQRKCPSQVISSFAESERLGSVNVPIVKDKSRPIFFCRLAKYQAPR